MLMLVAWLSACSTPDNSEPPAPLTDIAQPEILLKQWSLDTGEGVRQNYYELRPAVVAGKVITIDTEGEMRQVAADSGSTEWVFASGLNAIAGLEADQQNIVATSRKGEVALYQRGPDGPELQWQVEVGSEVRSPALLDRDLVFVRTGDGKVHSLRRSDGKLQWSVSRRVPALSLTGTSRPVAYEDLIIAGFDSGKLVAFDRVTGTSEWETTIGSPRGRTEIERLVDLDGQFLLRDGVVYVSSFQGNLAAVVATSGQIIWSREFSSARAIAADEQALYLVDDRSHVWSVDRRTGSAFWKQDILNARALTAPVVLAEHLVVADLEGYVHWLRKSDGQLVGRASAADLRVLAQPVVAGGNVLILDIGGQLVAVTHKPRS